MVEHFAHIFIRVYIYSILFSLRYISGWCLLFPIFSIILLFADPNSMWYLHATLFVIFNIFWSSSGMSGLLLINATSSIHRRQHIG